MTYTNDALTLAQCLHTLAQALPGPLPRQLNNNKKKAKRLAHYAVTTSKPNVYKRRNSPFWQCYAYVGSKIHRTSTKCRDQNGALKFAEEWDLELRGKHARGEIRVGKSFREAGELFLREYKVLTLGERNASYVNGHETRLRLHLFPFLGDKLVAEITSAVVRDYRLHRVEKGLADHGKPPAHQTIHQEIVVLRLVLKAAIARGWLAALPDLSNPYGRNSKISHRAWFSPEEYRKLHMATRRRARKQQRYSWQWQQLHDYVLILANTGLRPDEAARLEYRDVAVVDDEATGETILEIEVRHGKRGVGYCKSTANAVRPFLRLQKRNAPLPTDRLFPYSQRRQFGQVLAEEGLKVDSAGRTRAAYSLRHTYICFRLMEGADIYQIAKNCRTSVEMIEKFYAAHIKNVLDARAINVRRERPGRTKEDDHDQVKRLIRQVLAEEREDELTT